jgi:DNA-binding transcriptional ArsR family regulator
MVLVDHLAFCLVRRINRREWSVFTPPSAGTTKTKPARAGSRPGPSIKISGTTINGLAQVFKLLADESRLKILLALAQDGEKHVSSLCDLLGQTQPAVSHHLTLLRMSGLVSYQRKGKHNFYRVKSQLVRDLLEQFFADSGNGHKLLQFEDFSLSYRRQ